MGINQDIKRLFTELSTESQTQLLDDLLQEQELQESVLKEAQQELIGTRGKKPCPGCASTNIWRRGKQKNVQMYSCKDCNTWYSETTGTPLYAIKLKSKWQSYLRCMEKGMTLRDIAKELGISLQTSFDWRHKILCSFNQFVPKKLSSEIECDELELKLNNKGCKNLQRKPRKRGNDFKRNIDGTQPTVVQVVSAIERNGSMYFKAVESKRLTKEEITIALGDRLIDNAVLITDKHPSYKAFMKDHPTVKHKTLLAKDHVDKKDKTIHLQKVNNVHSQIRKFLRPFNGVSSKYLQNYLNWYAYIGEVRKTKTVLKEWFLSMLATDESYRFYELFKRDAVLVRT